MSFCPVGGGQLLVGLRRVSRGRGPQELQQGLPIRCLLPLGEAWDALIGEAIDLPRLAVATQTLHVAVAKNELASDPGTGQPDHTVGGEALIEAQILSNLEAGGAEGRTGGVAE